MLNIFEKSVNAANFHSNFNGILFIHSALVDSLLKTTLLISKGQTRALTSSELKKDLIELIISKFFASTKNKLSNIN